MRRHGTWLKIQIRSLVLLEGLQSTLSQLLMKKQLICLVKVREGFKKPRSTTSFSAGDSVKVIEGPFASFVKTVENVNANGKLKVNVSIFGRPTPVELDFSQGRKSIEV